MNLGRFIRLSLLAILMTSSSYAEVLALYDAQTGNNGDFNTDAFDSVDTEVITTATRMVQGGSLDGGGANAFVRTGSDYNTSNSGSPGFNFAEGTEATQALAASSGHFFSFDLQSGGQSVTYESLSFFSNQFDSGSNGLVDVSYNHASISETFILQNYTPVGNNANVTQSALDFGDFSTTETVTWTFYLYGATAANQATRFDDITLNGTVIPEPSSFIICTLGLGLLAWIRRRN